MSQDRFAKAWVTVLAAAGAALTLATWAQSDLVRRAGAVGRPPSVAGPVADEASGAVADRLGDDEPIDELPPMVATAVPSEPIGGSGAAAGSGEPAVGSGAVADLVPVTPSGTPEASPAVAPATRVATDDAPCGFELRRRVIAREIQENTPVEATSPLEANGRVVYLWFESSNTEGRSRVANVRWVHEPSGWVTGSSVELAISARWRTWAEFRPPATLVGPWRVEVIDDAGCQVDLIRFEMLPRGW